LEAARLYFWQWLKWDENMLALFGRKTCFNLEFEWLVWLIETYKLCIMYIMIIIRMISIIKHCEVVCIIGNFIIRWVWTYRKMRKKILSCCILVKNMCKLVGRENDKNYCDDYNECSSILRDYIVKILHKLETFCWILNHPD